MKFILILILLLSMASCQPQPHSTAADEAAVKATLTAMWDAIEKGDADRYATYVHPDFTQFGENDSLLTAGKAIEIESIRRYVTVAKGVHTEMVDPQVTIRGNTAWITYYWKDAGTKTGTAFSSGGKSTRIFIKENDAWLCVHGHYTNW